MPNLIDQAIVIRSKETVMTVKVSPKFQVVIPKDIRRSMGIKAGQKMTWLRIGSRIELVPVLPPRKLRGILKGANIDNIRDEEDRL